MESVAAFQRDPSQGVLRTGVTEGVAVGSAGCPSGDVGAGGLGHCRGAESSQGAVTSVSSAK